MQTPDIHSWTAERPTTVIDLEEHSVPDYHYPPAASSPQSYYALDTSAEGSRAKKRKVERACDFCRKRKTKCDGPKMPKNICTNCIQNSRSCTYIEGSKPRGPPKAYITTLEDRVERMEALLKRLRPEVDFIAELGPPVVRDSWKSESASAQLFPDPPAQQSRQSPSRSGLRNPVLLPLPTLVTCPTAGPSSGPSAAQRATGYVSSSPRAPNFRPLHSTQDLHEAGPASNSTPSTGGYETSSSGASSDNEEFSENLVQGMSHLTIRGLRPTQNGCEDVPDSQRRFHGKSYTFGLISSTRALKQQHMEEVAGATRQESYGIQPHDEASKGRHRRHTYWNPLPFELKWEGDNEAETPAFIMSHFPPMDLADQLVYLYLDRKNAYFPLFHRPTFERQWREGLYKHNMWFACVCMAVFGVASRYTDDPRVLPQKLRDEHPPDISDSSWSTAGWEYIEVAMDVHRRRRSLIIPPDLYEIQTFIIIANYLRGSLGHPESWTHISIGLRKAQDVGAHRRKVYGRKPTAEDELWKRAYWHLVAMDRLGSMFMGRPCASREEDLDLDLPLEVDDEYWENEDPNLSFQQPPDKPSTIAAFNCWIRLTQIAAYAGRTLYALGRSKKPLGLTGPRWREETVQRLNEAMIEWVDTLPDHLRLSGQMDNPVFYSQASTLFSQYHLLQIFVHRLFIAIPGPALRSDYRQVLDAYPGYGDSAQKPMTALSICTAAASAGTQILREQARRSMVEEISVIHVGFVYAGVLLVNLWTHMIDQISGPTRAKEPAANTDGLVDEIMQLVGLLEAMAPKWELAREASDDIRAALPPSSLRLGPAKRALAPEPAASPSAHDPPTATASAAGFRMDHPFTPHPAAGAGPAAYAGVYADPPLALQESPRWRAPQDALLGASRNSGWTVPDAYPARDEWAPEPQTPVAELGGVSQVRSTYDAYARAPPAEYGPDYSEYRAPYSVERLVREAHMTVPYIKREYPEEGGDMRLLPPGYDAQQGLPGPGPSSLPRQVHFPSYEVQSEPWNRYSYNARPPPQWPGGGSYPS